MSLFRRLGYEFGLGFADALLKEKPCVPFHPDRGRFAGVYFIDPITGVITVPQSLKKGVAYTGDLVFTDSTTGATGPGPVGALAFSDTATNGSASLSADGQAANFVLNDDNMDAMLVWHDPAGGVPDFSVELTTGAAAPSITGAFANIREGTTP